MGLYLLDYGAGNVQSLANSLKKLGHEFTWISSPEDFHKATVSNPLDLSFKLLTHSNGHLRALYSQAWVPLSTRSMD
jgi:hypothetical protein